MNSWLPSSRWKDCLGGRIQSSEGCRGGGPGCNCSIAVLHIPNVALPLTDSSLVNKERSDLTHPHLALDASPKWRKTEGPLCQGTPSCPSFQGLHGVRVKGLWSLCRPHSCPPARRLLLQVFTVGRCARPCLCSTSGHLGQARESLCHRTGRLSRCGSGHWDRKAAWPATGSEKIAKSPGSFAVFTEKAASIPFSSSSSDRQNVCCRLELGVGHRSPGVGLVPRFRAMPLFDQPDGIHHLTILKGKTEGFGKENRNSRGKG